MKERQGGASSISIVHAPYYMFKVTAASCWPTREAGIESNPALCKTMQQAETVLAIRRFLLRRSRPCSSAWCCRERITIQSSLWVFFSLAALVVLAVVPNLTTRLAMPWDLPCLPTSSSPLPRARWPCFTSTP